MAVRSALAVAAGGGGDKGADGGGDKQWKRLL